MKTDQSKIIPRNKRWKKATIIFAIIAIVVFIITITFLPYIKTEILTKKYGYIFQDGYKQTNMVSDVDYHKVIQYNEDYAEILYISDGAKDIISFKIDKNKEIHLDSWETIWSRSGSADGWGWFFYR